jgi:uncharacterized protein (TIGR02266 family)
MHDMKVMLVVSDGVFIEMVKYFLHNTGIKLIVCREYNQALDAIRQERPDIVYLSSRMDGGCVECLRAIKDDPDMRQIPVVMISAVSQEEYRQRCRESGCAYILMKPVDRRAFLSSIQSFIDPEKRDNARFAAQLDVSYGIDAPDSISVNSVNISSGGIFVQTTQPFPVDTILRIRVILPNPPTPIETKARVAWVNRLGAAVKPALPPGMALEFLERTPENTALISRYIRYEHIGKLLK